MKLPRRAPDQPDLRHQDERQRHLRDDKRFAQPAALVDSAPRLPWRSSSMSGRDMRNAGSSAKPSGAQQRKRDADAEDAAVQTHLAEAVDVGLTNRMAISPHHASTNPDGARGTIEVTRLSIMQLPHLLRRARAECRSHGQLAPARRGLREDDARDVRARDAEHDDGDQREQIDDGVDVRAEQLQQGAHDHAGFRVGQRIVGLELTCDGCEIGLGLLERKPGFSTAVTYNLRSSRRLRSRSRTIGVTASIVLKMPLLAVGRQHADDRVGTAVDRERLADRVLCGRELASARRRGSRR